MPFPPLCPAHVSAGALVDETKAAAPRGLHIPDRGHRDFLFFSPGDPVGSGLPTSSQCAARLRLVNQSTCGHVRRTQRGKWHPESSDCVLSTAALLGKTRERQPAHSEVTPQIAGLESCALRLRSVNRERGHSQGYLGELRSRSRVESAMALLIWNGLSEKRQRAVSTQCWRRRFQD